MFLYLARKRIKMTAAGIGAECLPGQKRVASCIHGRVDVIAIAPTNIGQSLERCGVNRSKVLLGFTPLATNPVAERGPLLQEPLSRDRGIFGCRPVLHAFKQFSHTGHRINPWGGGGWRNNAH